MNPWMTDADEAALAQFEAIVLSQQPAKTPWTAVTDYSWDARAPIEQPHADRIVAAFHPTRVVDIGAGPGHLARCLRERGVDVTEADRHPRDRSVLFYDLTEHTTFTPGYRAPLVICREVLEHLPLVGIRWAVSRLCALSTQFVYVTTRFVPNPTNFLAVAQSDDLDPTHISMVNQAFLRALFVLEGFKRRADLEEELDWKHLGRVLVYERVA